jgi:hypothetical protein
MHYAAENICRIQSTFNIFVNVILILFSLEFKAQYQLSILVTTQSLLLYS